jgi:hypothetical protein
MYRTSLEGFAERFGRRDLVDAVRFAVSTGCNFFRSGTSPATPRIPFATAACLARESPDELVVEVPCNGCIVQLGPARSSPWNAWLFIDELVPLPEPYPDSISAEAALRELAAARGYRVVASEGGERPAYVIELEPLELASSSSA